MAATTAAATAAAAKSALPAAPLLDKPTTSTSDTDDGDSADSTECSRQSSCMLPLDDSRLPWHKSPAKLAVLLLLLLSAGLVMAAILLQVVLEKNHNHGQLASTTVSRLIKVGCSTAARLYCRVSMMPGYSSAGVYKAGCKQPLVCKRQGASKLQQARPSSSLL
jgi:hypothetical protein